MRTSLWSMSIQKIHVNPADMKTVEGPAGTSLSARFTLRERSLSRQCDRNLVQADGVFEDQLVESLFP